MVFNFDPINVLVLIATCSNLIYGVIIYSRNRKSATNIAFFILTIGVGLWGASMLAFRGFVEGVDVIVSSRLLYLSATIIPIASLYFAKIFPEHTIRLNPAQRFLIPLPFLLMAILAVLPEGGLVRDVLVQEGRENILRFNFWWHAFYVAYVIGYFSWVFVILITKYKCATGDLRTQVSYIIAGTITTASISVVTNLILPFFSIFDFNWVGQISIAAMMMSITYAILKHHLFDVRIVATELFVFFLWVFILARALLSTSHIERISNLALLAITIVVGLLLIRSVIREVEQREHIEHLAKSLERANERLKELDKLKSEFVSIASHQLRSPLTAIKGYASLLLEGSFGKVENAAREAVQRIFESSNLMALSVEDFLNVSRIEQGRMKYELLDFDLRKLVQLAVDEMLPIVTKKGLTLSFSPGPDAHSVRADYGKMKQVVANLIDNAVKYTPRGSITVSFARSGKTVRIIVKDTGVGIPEATIGKLFDRFVRAENANAVNVSGTGLGLYIAKQMVEAMHGKVWAESEGEGKGSTFIVELPALTVSDSKTL